jgi:hypothetical protein
MRSPKTRSCELGRLIQSAEPALASRMDAPIASSTDRPTSGSEPGGVSTAAASDGRTVTTNVAINECGRKRRLDLFRTTEPVSAHKQSNLPSLDECCEDERRKFRVPLRDITDANEG